MVRSPKASSDLLPRNDLPVNPILQLDPAQLHTRLEAGDAPLLLDVREAEELAIARLDGVVHIPLGELTQRSEELDQAAEIVCICHHGIRSQRAAQYLASIGFERLLNLRGGMDAWSEQVDPSLTRY